MSRLAFFAVLLGIAAVTAEPAAAQRQKSDKAFERQSPGIGEPMPDVTAYDAEGRPFRLRDLKGHYTVLVFGCLT